MRWQRIQTLFRKGREYPVSVSGEQSLLPRSRRALSELFEAQQPKSAQETLATLRLLTVPEARHAELQNYILALEYAVRGEHLKAIEVYSRLIGARDPWRLASLLFARGQSYAALGRYDDAIADYEFPLRNIDIPTKDEFSGRWGLFLLFRASRQPESASGMLRDLIGICTRLIEDPQLKDNPFFHYQRALARAALRQYSEAIADCQSALKAAGSRDNADLRELEAAIVAEASIGEK